MGKNLTLREKGRDRGLIVQIIAFRTITYPSLLAEIMDLMADDPLAPAVSLPEPLVDQEGLPEMSNLKPAIAKIRKVVQWTQPIPQIQMAGSQV